MDWGDAIVRDAGFELSQKHINECRLGSFGEFVCKDLGNEGSILNSLDVHAFYHIAPCHGFEHK